MLKKNRDKHCKKRPEYFLVIILISVFQCGYGLASDKVNNKKSAVSSFVKSSSVDNPRLLVRFKNGVSSSTKNNLHRTLGSRIRESVNTVPGLQVVDIAPGVNLKNVLRQYQKDPSVLYAEPDYKIRLKFTPDDTLFEQLWGLNNTGRDGGTRDADINAPEAWDVTTGSNDVVVAVIDTGVDYTHIDLVGNIWTNPGEIPGNGIDDDGNGYIDDIHGIDPSDNDTDPMDDIVGHGTHIAGTIGARGNNNLGVTGINWNVSIIACKIFSSSSVQDTEAFVSDAVKCLDYLRDLKLNHGVNIVATNNSWGWIGSPSQTLIDAIDRQRQAGILFVAAAGNDFLDTDEIADNPSSYYLPNVISVAASNRNDSLADFSNTGKRTVHVAAPGEAILSTVPMGTGTDYDNYDNLSGTSMASPHVVGLLALLKAQNNARDWIELKNLLVSSGTQLNELANTTVSGRRIRAFDSDNTGSMSCVNQSILSRLQPRIDNLGVEPNSSTGISMLHINCESPAGEMSVLVSDTGETVTLTDNGIEYDQVAGDGIYSAQIDLNAMGLERATLEFPDSTTVNIRNASNYLTAVSIPYQWRDISAIGQPVVVGDDVTGYVNTPFDIIYGNNTSPYTKLAIDSNGYIVMQRTGDPVLSLSNYFNFPIPYNSVQNIVAPFWDDLVVVDSANLIWGVLGSAPNRELVVTWNNVKPYDGSPGISFQVVFKENSSDVIFNYQDVDAPDPATDKGNSATVGVQVAPYFGQQYSFDDNTKLSSNFSLRWSMPNEGRNLSEGPASVLPSGNIVPIANAGTVQVVSENNIVILSGSGIDTDGTINSYRWTQISGIPVTLSNSNTRNPSFIAPAVNEAISLIFQLTVTDNDGATGTDQVVVVVNDLSTTESPRGRVAPGGGGGWFGLLFLLLIPVVMLVRLAKGERIRC